MEEPVDITPYLDQLDESLRDKVLQLQKGRCVQTRLPTSAGPAAQALPSARWVWQGYSLEGDVIKGYWGHMGWEEGSPVP